MGWFSKPSPPPEPVYSELGAELYRMLEEVEGQWEILHPNVGMEGVHHYKSNFYLELYPRSSANQRLHVKLGRHDDYGNGLNHTLTADDLRRLLVRVKQVIADDLLKRKYSDMKAALEKIKPNPFDAEARALARCVLSGDASAARPLVDKLIKLNGEGRW